MISFKWTCVLGWCLLLLVSWTGTDGKQAEDFLVDIEDMMNMFRDAFGTVRNRNEGDGKEQARDYIRNFTEGEELVEQTFKSFIEFESYESTGINFIHIIRGSKWGTSEDRPMLVGAHYDTVPNSPGVDDNGSGMVALLSAAKYITNYLNDNRYTLKYSLFFVAFDFEETTGTYDDDDDDDDEDDIEFLLGSNIFVEQYLVPKILDEYNIPYDNFQGALILETMMNWDDTEESQALPSGFEVMYKEEYDEFVAGGKRGNFIAAICRGDDIALGRTFEKHWNKSPESDKYTTWVLELPFSGRPDDLPDSSWNSLTDMFRSDHYRFWNHGDGNGNGLKSIQLTDTANLRSSCYHNACDDLSSITVDKLHFLAKTTDTVIKMALEATQPATSQAERLSGPSLQMIIMAIIGCSLVGM